MCSRFKCFMQILTVKYLHKRGFAIATRMALQVYNYYSTNFIFYHSLYKVVTSSFFDNSELFLLTFFAYLLKVCLWYFLNPYLSYLWANPYLTCFMLNSLQLSVCNQISSVLSLNYLDLCWFLVRKILNFKHKKIEGKLGK